MSIKTTQGLQLLVNIERELSRMYLTHFNLKHKPFQISTDPRFLWMGEKHKEAFATLKYGVLDNKGFLLLTGDVGTGKTTLINALLKVLGSDVTVATVRDPTLTKRDFFNYIARAFGMEKQEFENKGDFLNHFSRFLNDVYYRGKKVLLIIDEAQKLKQDLLEEVRLLSNIEREDAKLLNIFFVGQNEFNGVLHRPVNRALRQRITVHYNIQPFSAEETGEYIKHRLKIAGAAVHLFQPRAIQEVYVFSKGYPRLINIICDRALLTGFVREAKVIDADIVQECAEELKIPDSTKKEKTAPAQREMARGNSTAGENRQGRAAPPRQSLWNTVLAVGVLTCLITTILLAGYVFIFRDRPLFWGEKEILSVPGPAATVSSPLSESAREQLAAGSETEVSAALQEAGGGSATTEEHGAEPGMAPESAPVVKAPTEAAPAAPAPAETAPAFLPGEKISIPFGNDSIMPVPESLDSLNAFAEKLKKNLNAKIVLKGYTDATGNERYNQKLSEFRANALKGYLVARGISESRIATIGAGTVIPQAGSSKQSERFNSRRVEIEVVTD